MTFNRNFEFNCCAADRSVACSRVAFIWVKAVETSSVGANVGHFHSKILFTRRWRQRAESRGQTEERQIEKDPDILKFISNILHNSSNTPYAMYEAPTCHAHNTPRRWKKKKTNNFAHQKQYYVEALISFRMIGVIRVCARRVVHKQSVAMNIQKAGVCVRVLGNFVMQTMIERIKK